MLDDISNKTKQDACPQVTDTCDRYVTSDFCMISVLYLYYCEILEAVLGTPGRRGGICSADGFSLVVSWKRRNRPKKASPSWMLFSSQRWLPDDTVLLSGMASARSHTVLKQDTS